MSAHDHAHDDHGHHAHATHEGALKSAFLLIAGFMLVEAVVGVVANSLTLIADAGHMLLDASALGFSWYAVRLSERNASESLSYGYHRFQVLAAFVNGLALIALCIGIVIAAVARLQTPATMIAGLALAVAAIGLAVNLIAYRILHGVESSNLNVESAMLHVLGDLLGSVAAIAAAGTVLLTGWPYADPLLAALVTVILLRGALKVLRDAAHILLEGVPRHLDVEQIRVRLSADLTGRAEIHHVHAWALTMERPLITLHARVLDGSDGHAIVGQIKAQLASEFGLAHSTVQLEIGPCLDDEH